MAAANNNVTGPVSHFLHSKLKEAVSEHPLVLNDDWTLIWILEEVNFEPSKRITLTATDANALYPFILFDKGLATFR